MLFKVFIFVLTLNLSNAGWGSSNDPGKVLLRDVQVLTLKSGQMTTGRRSSPVPQMKCIGGSAQGQFNPQAVQVNFIKNPILKKNPIIYPRIFLVHFAIFSNFLFKQRQRKTHPEKK
jgi:hypothetical protein